MLILPEGTRVYPGDRRSYARSGVELAIKNGAPIVAVAHNAGVFWPNKKYCLYPGSISVFIGSNIAPPDSPSKAQIQHIAEWIEHRAALPQ